MSIEKVEISFKLLPFCVCVCGCIASADLFTGCWIPFSLFVVCLRGEQKCTKNTIGCDSPQFWFNYCLVESRYRNRNGFDVTTLFVRWMQIDWDTAEQSTTRKLETFCFRSKTIFETFVLWYTEAMPEYRRNRTLTTQHT